MDLQRFIRHFSSVDKSAAPNRYMGYPQVLGSMPVETPRTQIRMDLSQLTLEQGFSNTVFGNKSK